MTHQRFFWFAGDGLLVRARAPTLVRLADGPISSDMALGTVRVVFVERHRPIETVREDLLRPATECTLCGKRLRNAVITCTLCGTSIVCERHSVHARKKHACRTALEFINKPRPVTSAVHPLLQRVPKTPP